MKKHKQTSMIVAVVLLIVSLLCLAGCKSDSAELDENIPTTTLPATVTTTEPTNCTEPSTAATEQAENMATTEPTVTITEPTAAPTTTTTEPSVEFTQPTTEVSQPGNESTTPTGETADTEHRHNYSKTVMEPTCSVAGYTVYTCDCGNRYTADNLPATGHEWGNWEEVKAPTTSAAGTAERKCSNCSATETKTLDKLPENHEHSYTGTVTAEPTCIHAGVKTYTCACGSFYTEDIAPTGDHNYVSSIVEPTCIYDGYTIYTCSVCGRCEHGNYVEETGHTYSKETVVAPTCTEAGHTLRICDVCQHHDYINFVQPTGHTYTWERGLDNINRGVCGKCENAWICDPAASVAAPEVVDIVNRYRAAEGLDPVEYYWEAQDGTNRRAAEVAVFFSHDRPDGSSWTSAFDNGYFVNGECIARGTTSAEGVVTMWMNSPGHRAIIMSPSNILMVVARNGASWALNVM